MRQREIVQGCHTGQPFNFGPGTGARLDRDPTRLVQLVEGNPHIAARGIVHSAAFHRHVLCNQLLHIAARRDRVAAVDAIGGPAHVGRTDSKADRSGTKDLPPAMGAQPAGNCPGKPVARNIQSPVTLMEMFARNTLWHAGPVLLRAREMCWHARGYGSRNAKNCCPKHPRQRCRPSCLHHPETTTTKTRSMRPYADEHGIYMTNSITKRHASVNSACVFQYFSSDSDSKVPPTTVHTRPTIHLR